MKMVPSNPGSSNNSLDSQSSTNDFLQERLKLQGQCKIASIELLEISYLKIFFFLVPTIASIIGIFFIKYYMSIRAKLFFWQSNLEQATHILIRGNQRKDNEIVKISLKGEKFYFFYRKLKYEVYKGKAYPVAINLHEELRENINDVFLRNGFNDQTVRSRSYQYGLNEHIVDAPTYYEYLYDVMTEPFFFIQYLAATIYIVLKLIELSILLLGTSVLTTSINYLLLYVSYRKIKDISETIVSVQVLRNGEFVLLPSNQIVPGDIFIPNEEICCDAVIIKGEVYVNQSNLTGESVPMGKFGFNDYSNWIENDNSKWIYEGAKIVSSVNPIVMAIYTGYTTKRGQILRKILNRPVIISELFRSCLYFLLLTCIVGLTLYLSTMSVRLSNGNLQTIVIVLDALLVITLCFPPGCPIYFNLVYSFCLMRLKMQNILGTQPEKTIQPAHLKIMCFDKTGTLTEDKVEIVHIYKFLEQSYRDIRSSEDVERLDFKIFGSCHTVRSVDSNLLGDEIDLKMFLHSSYFLKHSKNQQASFEVQTVEGLKFNNIQVLKVFQYQSKFQSMSVLVYDSSTSKYYVFAKGAPEMIHANSIKKYSYFNDLLQNVSFRGFRSIAYGFKEVNKNDLEKYLQANRNFFMKDIQILGFLVFQNKLKSDASETIGLLREANIESKIITGDNVYIAIETSIRCGILSRNEQIAIIQGEEQTEFSNSQISQRKITLKKLSFNSQNLKFERSVIDYQEFLNYESSMVIDNNFLNKLSKDKLLLCDNIKVFCRISTQNKALIISMFKEKIKDQFKRLTRVQKIFSPMTKKIGMIGDGSNDLLAIRQADIGIGIKNCDSSYAASFSVEYLKHIDTIVREAKCSEREIVEIVRFISITSFISVPVVIIMETEGAYYSSFQLIFGNLSKYIVLNIFLALSRSCAKQTIYTCCSNFMKLENQLIYWGNVIIGTLGHLVIMIYYRGESEYIWNYKYVTTSTGWTSFTSLVSSQYLFYHVHPIALVFGIYVSSPWKQPIHKNYILFTALVLNIVFIIILFLFFEQLEGFFGFVHISTRALRYIALICGVNSLLVLIYNGVINSLNLHLRQQGRKRSTIMVATITERDQTRLH